MKEKFTIILTHYKQEKYIKEALDSIFIQTYKNIELIVADDCSPNFNSKEIENYILSKSSTIEYKFMINDENLGTVKTLNKALHQATGEYILIFAADDILKDKQVIKKYVEIFKNNKKYEVISSICLLYDDLMQNINGKFPEKNLINNFNKLSSKNQNKALKFGPVFAPGATAYRSKIFKKINYLEEKYSLIEDWSLFLRLTRLGYKIYLQDFVSIKHRGGGVSENNKLPKKVSDKILRDTDLIYRSEVFPNYKKLATKEKLQILYRYQIFVNTYGYKYWPIYLNYYWMIFTDIDLLIYKILMKKDILLKLFVPILSIILSSIIYQFINYKLILVIFPIILYLILRKIINVSYLRRMK